MNGLTCGAVEIVKSLDRHITSKLNKLQSNPSQQQQQQHHQQQHDKNSPPQSQSSFYVVPDINVIKSISTEHLPQNNNNNSTNIENTIMTDRSSKKVTVSKSTPNLDKQDSGSSSTGSSGYKSNHTYLQNNDEFGRQIENYERTKQIRNKRNQSNSNTSGIKPSTIMSLEDRDLIIIDNTDIKEAIGNQADVIIVDPPALPDKPNNAAMMSQSELDLKDILGDNWPSQAGDLAPLLNTEKKASIVKTNSTVSSNYSHSNNSKYERNKSMNPISHLMTTTTTKQNKEMRDFSTSTTTEFVNGHHKRSK